MTALPDWDVASDAELVRAAAAGDRQAFAEIYDRYGTRLHDFCIGMVRNRDVAADCVQDVFCIAATRLCQLNNPDSLRPWLYSIAHREALRSLHRSGREPAVEVVPDKPSAEAGPDTLAARHELAELIAAAEGGLSERDREVLDLSYRHGLDNAELAEALGVSASSAKKLNQRLRDTIERSLGALLVSRSVVVKSDGCAELRAILDGWDGQLNVLLRKRIARHIESCPVCEEERSRLVNPVALLGAAPAFVRAPDWLRARTLGAVQLPDATGQRDTPARARSSRRALLRTAVVVAAAVLAVLAVIAAWGYEEHHAVTPANVTRSVPPPNAVSPKSAVPQPRLAPSSPSVARSTQQSATTAVIPSSAVPEPPSQAPPVTGPVSTSEPTTSMRPVRPPDPPPVEPTEPVITAPPRPVVPPRVSATPVQPSTPVKVRPSVPLMPIPITTQPPVIQ